MDVRTATSVQGAAPGGGGGCKIKGIYDVTYVEHTRRSTRTRAARSWHRVIAIAPGSRSRSRKNNLQNLM